MTKQSSDYKTLSQKLDQILEQLQSADLDIDEAVSKYEQGMELLRALEAQLKQAENKVKKVKTDSKP